VDGYKQSNLQLDNWQESRPEYKTKSTM